MPLLVSNRPNNFDAIRIFMALLVVWSHAFALYFGSEAAEPISLLTHGLVNAGNIAVDVFFVVSGFLIAKSFERSRTWWSYLKKRIARIYPGYIVATSICAFVLLPLYAGTHYNFIEIAKTIGMNLVLKGWFVNSEPFVSNHGHALNGSLWSIPFEFWCYLGVLAFGMLRLGRVTLIAVFALVIALDVWTIGTGKIWGGGIAGLVLGWPNVWFTVAPFFIAGMLFYFYRAVAPRSVWIAVVGLTLVIVCGWLIPLAGIALLPVVVSYAVLYWAFSARSVQVAKYGDFSYGSYLYAFPIQQLLLAFTNLSFPAFVAASMLLTLCAGVLSWFAVERWFHTARKVTVPPLAGASVSAA
jgi:peptidoglycan/LPS O-acetylase OafA/YrhL